jgi:nucleoside-diphosphate-sugar epimerase
VTTANSALRPPPDTAEAVDMQGNRDLIRAAAGAGVGRFIFMSAYGATIDHPMPFTGPKR